MSVDIPVYGVDKLFAVTVYPCSGNNRIYADLQSLYIIDPGRIWRINGISVLASLNCPSSQSAVSETKNDFLENLLIPPNRETFQYCEMSKFSNMICDASFYQSNDKQKIITFHAGMHVLPKNVLFLSLTWKPHCFPTVIAI